MRLARLRSTQRLVRYAYFAKVIHLGRSCSFTYFHERRIAFRSSCTKMRSYHRTLDTSQPAHNAETGVLRSPCRLAPSELWVLICNRLSAENGHRSLRTFASCSTTCLRHVVASSRGPALRQNVQVMSLQTAQAAPRQRQLAQSGLAASTLGRPRRCQRCLALRSSVQRRAVQEAVDLTSGSVLAAAWRPETRSAGAYDRR
jgi:hypothetical protein